MFGFWNHYSGNHTAGGALQTLTRGLKDLLFPLKCLECRVLLNEREPDRRGACRDEPPRVLFDRLMRTAFCPECLDNGITPISAPFCTQCSRMFDSRQGESHLCQDCMTTPSPIGRVRAYACYEGGIKQAVKRFKYGKQIRLAEPLGQMLFRAFSENFTPDSIDLILPVPLHRGKLKKRGFNQSLVLLRRFKEYERQVSGGPGSWILSPWVLKRVRPTRSQAGLDRKAREVNMSRAFMVPRNRDVRGLRILLVDDVYTTGATCRAAASVLKAAGALSVDVLILARA